MSEEEGSLEERVFKSLSNERRREIVRYLGERRRARFNELKRDLGFDDGASLTYHLGSLEPLLTRVSDGYSLSSAGRDAYSLMNKVSSVSEATATLASARSWVAAMIVANSVLWAAAILSVRLYIGNLHGSILYSFSALFLVSNASLNAISQRLRGGSR